MDVSMALCASAPCDPFTKLLLFKPCSWTLLSPEFFIAVWEYFSKDENSDFIELLILLLTKPVSCVQLFWDLMDRSLPNSFCPWDFPGKDTPVDYRFLL